MRKRRYIKCVVLGCGSMIIGDRVDWAIPVCVGCLPPPPPLPIVRPKGTR